MNIIAVRMSGRAAMEAGYAAHFAGALAKASLAFTDLAVRPLSDGAALCVAAWSRQALPSADGNTLPPGTGVFTFVAVKRDGDWLFAGAQNTEAGALPVRKA